MEIAHITPTAHLERLLRQEFYHLVLTKPTLEDPRYLEFYKYRIGRSDHVILDNDAHEMKSASTCQKLELLQRAIDLLDPTEVVLPDNYGDGMDGTLAKAIEGIKQLHFSGRYMAVPRGKTVFEYLECASKLWAMNEVSCLGVYYMVEQELNIKRSTLVDLMSHRPGMAHMQLHLLGEGSDLGSLRDTKLIKHPAVRGLDTAKIVNWAFYDELTTPARVPPHKGRYKQLGYFAEELTPGQVEIAEQNIAAWRRHAGY